MSIYNFNRLSTTSKSSLDSLCHRVYDVRDRSEERQKVLFSSIDMDSSLSSIPTSGVFRSLSDSPPTHSSVHIESFSLLSDFLDRDKDAYTSEEFKAGGYKWKLVIHPKGNKKKKVEDHISIYLQIAGANSFEIGWEVYVDFRLFLLDQNRNVYVVFEDAFTRTNCIHGAKLDVGFDKLVPLAEFHDESQGYLVDDNCVFGAEVFVCKETRRGMGECISRVKNPLTYKHIWKLHSFSSRDDPFYISEPFTAGGQKWIIKLYPKGIDEQDRHISIFLKLADQKATPPATKVFAEFSICIVNPWCGFYWHRMKPVKWCFTAGEIGYGWRSFAKMNCLSQILCLDTCVVETMLTVHGVTEGACDSDEEDSSMKTKRADVDPNNIQSNSKGSMCCFYFMSVSVMVLLLAKNKALLGHWFGSTKT